MTQPWVLSSAPPCDWSVKNAQPVRTPPVPVPKNIPAAELKRVDVKEARRQNDLFEELAIPLFPQLYNFAHWLTQNREEAEDLVQETYAKALKGFASYQQGTNYRAWMYRILRNSFLTSRSGLRVKMTVPLDSDEDGTELAIEAETPETLLMSQSDSEAIRKAIDSLPVHHREVILLCEVEEMSYQEISETLSIPMGTVMSRLSRARRALRDMLQLQFGKGQSHGV